MKENLVKTLKTNKLLGLMGNSEIDGIDGEIENLSNFEIVNFVKNEIFYM